MSEPLDMLVSWGEEPSTREQGDRYEGDPPPEAGVVARLEAHAGPPPGEVFQWTAERDRALEEALAGQGSLAEVRVVREVRAALENRTVETARRRLENELPHWVSVPAVEGPEGFNEAVFCVRNGLSLCLEACALADQPVLAGRLLEEAEASLLRGRALMLAARPVSPPREGHS